MNRTALYMLLNLVVCMGVLAGYGMHKDVAHPLYVIALFALCSTPILESRAINGPYALLVFWSAFDFLTYGALDLRNLLLGIDGDFIPADGLFDKTEVVILVGTILVQVLYRVACARVIQTRSDRPIKNWSESTLIAVGLLMWAVSSRLCWEFSVNLLTEKTAAATVKGLESIGGIGVAAFMIARMMQPLSIMILAYAQCRFRRPYMAPLVLGLVLYQVFYGFVIDTKGEAFSGAIIVLVTAVLVRGRVSKGWMALIALIVAVGFPILQANRVVRDENNVNATKASQNLGKIFQEALQAKDRVNTGQERAQTALERTTTKGSVELIVRGIDSGHQFMHGYTLTPLFAAFVPRLIWGDKPSIPTGQILNKEFNVSAGRDTYISPSHLGEMYWNFGWVGVIVGMSGLGWLLGTVGAKFDLTEAATITRLLVAVVTVRQIIVGAEGEIAVQYVVWMRSLAGIGLLHLLLARTPWKAMAEAMVVTETPPAPNTVREPPLFPNLLR